MGATMSQMQPQDAALAYSKGELTGEELGWWYEESTEPERVALMSSALALEREGLVPWGTSARMERQLAYYLQYRKHDET